MKLSHYEILIKLTPSFQMELYFNMLWNNCAKVVFKYKISISSINHPSLSQKLRRHT